MVWKFRTSFSQTSPTTRVSKRNQNWRKDHSPRNFYKLIPSRFFFFLYFFFFVIFTGIRCGHRFFCDSHALLGESRGLEDIFCNFYKINSSQDLFLYCKNFGVDGRHIGIPNFKSNGLSAALRSPFGSFRPSCFTPIFAHISWTSSHSALAEPL